ncbi:hypothetical protein Hanom_Chr03g00263051 [Helianthus anomalus]
MHMSRIRGGICTVEPSDPRQDVIDGAIYLFKQQKGFEDYNVARKNYEDFTLYCKTEHMIREKLTTGGSDQVNSILEASWKPAVESVFLKVVFRTPLSPVMVAVTLGRYSWDRYQTDIGAQADVIRSCLVVKPHNTS